MVKIDIRGESVYFDGYLHKDLKFIRNAVLKNNNMFICCIDGRPGSGKTTLASTIAKFLDPDINLNRVCFSIPQFKKALQESKKGDCIILDESFDVMNRRRAASKANMEILSLLQMMRAKNVFILLCLPSVFDIDKSILLNLVDMFIHVYRQTDFGKRGYFACYTRVSLKYLWLYCRQSLRYSRKVAKPQYTGRFTSKFMLDEKAYEKKKFAAIESQKDKQVNEQASEAIIQRDKMILHMKEQGMKNIEIAKVCGLKANTISYCLSRAKKNKNKDEKEDILDEDD